MEKKNKKELISIIEEQDKNLHKYKSRLHDIIGSYKNLLSEKETLQNSIKTLTETSSFAKSSAENSKENENSVDKQNDQCIKNLKSSLGALTAEKARIENELKADRKKILQQKEELENKILNQESKLIIEKEKYDQHILELRTKISNQQKEREKEQQDHVLMLKELQAILANERTAKEKLEQQVSEIHLKFSSKVPEKKLVEHEKYFNDLQNELKVSQENYNILNNNASKKDILLQKIQEENENIKVQYQDKIDEEKKRADTAEEKLGMLIFVKEKRIASLENRISELSAIVGDNDKLKQQDQMTIQKLKTRILQLQSECSMFSQVSAEDPNLWEYKESCDSNSLLSKSESETNRRDSLTLSQNENLHAGCQAEISQIKSELEQYKIKCESILKEKFHKSSVAMLSDVKHGKENKELKCKITDLQNQLQSCKSQLKLNEEYHSKITSNIEKACEDLKLQHKKEIAEMQMSHKTQLLEFEHQIQKQRERTLLLLDEKDKEISLLKSSFLSPFIKKEKYTDNNVMDEEEPALDKETAANILSHSLISSKKDGHMLHYVQELARKDVEISNLRQARVQSESALRKLQHALTAVKEKYFDEVDMLQSRIKLLESTQDQEGTNVEYLKNVVLRFLKCCDRNSRKHMINAIATVLHFTNNEIEEIKDYI